MEFILGKGHQEDIRLLREVVVFRDVVINQSVLFAIHDFVDKTLEANKYIKALPEINLSGGLYRHFNLLSAILSKNSERRKIN